MNLTVALRKLLMPEDPLADVAAELKRLTPEDKEDFRRLFAESGVEIDPEPVPAQA
jgi:DNA-directed RNA polymerase subunit F